MVELDPGKRTLLVTGASQGARSINAAILGLLDLWKAAKGWQIIHLTGPADYEQCRRQYEQHGIAARVMAFTEHMADCLAVADLVISRAGASALAEITFMGVPSILMPYPFDRRQHQLANARVLIRNHAAELVEDRNDPQDNAARLGDQLRDLMGDDQRRRRMGQCAAGLGRGDSAEVIARALLDLVHGRT